MMKITREEIIDLQIQIMNDKGDGFYAYYVDKNGDNEYVGYGETKTKLITNLTKRILTLQMGS